MLAVYAALPSGVGSLRASDLRWSPWIKLEGFRLNSTPNAVVAVRHRDERRLVRLDDIDNERAVPVKTDDKVVLFHRGEAYEFTLDTGERSADEGAAGDGAILSPMPGKIVSVAVKAGAKLKKGDPILVLEAMKMEHTLTAPFDGKLAELNAKAGAQVSEGVLLAKLEKD